MSLPEGHPINLARGIVPVESDNLLKEYVQTQKLTAIMCNDDFYWNLVAVVGHIQSDPADALAIVHLSAMLKAKSNNKVKSLYDEIALPDYETLLTSPIRNLYQYHIKPREIAH